jgi:release factor glutamine methyltransferase
VAALVSAGCIAAEEEADTLLAAAAGDGDRLADLVARRCTGEPLAWLVGSVRFCGETIAVHPGVYVPRWQTEAMALEAATRLPDSGIAVDLCTGAGAIAVVLRRRRPGARVVATDIDPRAVACARANGVDAYEGDLAAGLPADVHGVVDVVTAVVPYVPTEALHLLPRDVLAYEPRAALDGGPGGTRDLERAAVAAAGLLRPDGSLLLELGGDQADALELVLAEHGYRDVEHLDDANGDRRALACRKGGPAGRSDRELTAPT